MDSTTEINTAEPLTSFGIQDFGDTYTFLEQTNKRAGVNVIAKQSQNAFHLQWVLGYSYSKIDIKDARFALMRHSTDDVYKLPDDFPISNLAGTALTDSKQAYDGLEREMNSIFTQFKWETLTNIYLLAGGRLDDHSDFDTQLTPRAGIIYMPTQVSALKLLYGNAFRAPSGIEMNGVANTLGGNKNLDAEHIDIYELIYMHKGDEWKIIPNMMPSQIPTHQEIFTRITGKVNPTG